MNHHLVGALEPLGQDVLLQLQEELVPERERERERGDSLHLGAFHGRGEWDGVGGGENGEEPSTHFGSLAPGGSENEREGRKGRDERRGIFK